MIPDWLDPVLSGRLCLTLLHSLWQVALLTAFAVAVDRHSRSGSAERTYSIYTAALLISIAALPVTWYLVDVRSLVDSTDAQFSTLQPAQPPAAADWVFNEDVVALSLIHI